MTLLFNFVTFVFALFRFIPAHRDVFDISHLELLIFYLEFVTDSPICFATIAYVHVRCEQSAEVAGP